jgi:hypothetical protein
VDPTYFVGSTCDSWGLYYVHWCVCTAHVLPQAAVVGTSGVKPVSSEDVVAAIGAGMAE